MSLIARIEITNRNINVWTEHIGGVEKGRRRTNLLREEIFTLAIIKKLYVITDLY